MNNFWSLVTENEKVIIFNNLPKWSLTSLFVEENKKSNIVFYEYLNY